MKHALTFFTALLLAPLAALVDLEKDPGEMRNLAADPAYAEVIAQHRRYLREWVEMNQDKITAEYLIQ